MKNIKIYIFLCLWLASMGCDDNLDLAPVSQLGQNSFYNTEDDYTAAINAAYSSLRSSGQFGDIVLFGDIRSDNTVPVLSGSVTTRTDFDEFSLNAANPRIQSTWQNTYNGIARTNGILVRIDEATIDEAFKNLVKGEALFLRGLMYFNLVRIYGDVPLVLNEISPEEAFQVGQNDANDIYTQIISDLTAAASLLPAIHSDDIGRATNIAANALLGRVYLTLGDFPQTVTTLRKVTAQSPSIVNLLSNYADVFDIANEYNQEIIFAVRWTNDGQNGNGFNFGFANVNEPDNKATPDVYDEYETGDLRRDLTWDATISTADTILVKYGFAPAGQGESDWPVIRYADVLLMLSEALNEEGYVSNGEAFDLLNQIRARAGLGSLTSVEVPDQAAFRLAIEHERRMELAGEGHRWFDLVRTGRFMDVMNGKGFNVEPRHRVFPIPQREIDNVNDPTILSQNTGY
ncbi:RagB/SusD family nutrient uptake outer membrane protein [Fulvivirgaceae bacterium BMA12]|uniref:RagB/SusD family nutrient uptake outer membrane protein n=1 Tax=Agaribacillus aureus TaxID=3051825 RepID=A0ABT8LEP7_9BACT|nr:RagB/SusD family nutrient uptake outer membrane protein [Fulvivirgaceae bacterium BMA12]